MVSIIILIYLLFVSIVLINKKRKVRANVKNFKRKKLVCSNKFYFVSRNSKKFAICNCLLNSCVIFKSEKDFNKFVLPLKQIGVDYKKNIYKLEMYKNFSFDKKKKELQILKSYKKVFNFYTFIFVDSIKNIEIVNDYLKKIGFEEDVKVFYCLDVSYELLSSINFFDVNYENYLVKNQNYNNSIIFNNAKREYKLKRLRKSEKTELVEGFYLKTNITQEKLNNFNFNQNKLECKKEIEGCEVNLTKTLNINNLQEVFCLKIINKNSNNKIFKFGFCKSFEVFNEKFVGILNCKKVLSFQNKNTNSFFMFSKFFNKISFVKNSIVLSKEIKIKPFEEKNFYFVKSFENKNMCKNCNFKMLFESSLKNFDDITKIKVLSKNSSLNNLINNVLPSLIVEEVLTNPVNSFKNFNNFLNLSFDANLVKKDLISVPISNFYLKKSNFFELYFNLIYFYFGVWKGGGFSVILNNDKSLILENSSIIFNVNNQKFLIENKKENLTNEVKINNISYTNLKFINFKNFLDEGKNKLEICF